MKTYISTYVWLVILALTARAGTDPNCWQKFRRYSSIKAEEITDELRKEAADFLKSLTLEELILIGRELSKELANVCPETVFCEKTQGSMTFFYVEYPKKGGLKDIEPLLAEIENTQLTNLWRGTLIDFLGQNADANSFTADQLYSALDVIGQILGTKDEHYWLRFESVQSVRNMLKEIEKRNLRDDPVVRSKLQEGKTLELVKKEIAEGKIAPSESYEVAQAKVMVYYDIYAQRLLSILRESDTKRILQQQTLSVLGRVCLHKPINSRAEIRSRLEHAVRGYKEYDESLWFRLLSIGFDNIGLSDATAIGIGMLRDAKAGRNRNHIHRIIKKHEKR